jgi:hypothetical protein
VILPRASLRRDSRLHVLQALFCLQHILSMAVPSSALARHLARRASWHAILDTPCECAAVSVSVGAAGRLVHRLRRAHLDMSCQRAAFSVSACQWVPQVGWCTGSAALTSTCHVSVLLSECQRVSGCRRSAGAPAPPRSSRLSQRRISSSYSRSRPTCSARLHTGLTTRPASTSTRARIHFLLSSSCLASVMQGQSVQLACNHECSFFKRGGGVSLPCSI